MGCQVAVKTGMGSTKQDFAEWYEMPRPELNAGKFGFNSNHSGEEKANLPAASIERMAVKGPAIFGIEAKIGVVTCDFRL
jgi:hypothetical protein